MWPILGLFGFRLRLIPLVMLMQVVANQSLQLIPFFAQFFKGARPFLRGVRRHFAVVDREQFVTQEALFMAHQQYLLEQLFNLIGVLADELSQGGEMRHGIAG